MRRVTYLSEPVTNPEVEAHGTAMADVLRPFRGRYVARKDGQVLFDADTPGEVVAWLRQQHIEGAVVFRVPVDPRSTAGATAVLRYHRRSRRQLRARSTGE